MIGVDGGKKERSIVVEWLPEPAAELTSSAKQRDLEGKVYRMCKYEPGRVRKVKIVLPSKSHWAIAPSNSWRLRDSTIFRKFAYAAACLLTREGSQLKVRFNEEVDVIADYKPYLPTVLRSVVRICHTQWWQLVTLMFIQFSTSSDYAFNEEEVVIP
ncbi:unnamed protein product [Heligmosomoides polygyrus]|uniref:MSP domain-containing protein n=1 Tax=Heligmosomoides polygyrus TaxID=6339 RepID=A0A183GAV6_HELPZ|nr:unnamed protein product [Heligmosomoides polygyrus]